MSLQRQPSPWNKNPWDWKSRPFLITVKNRYKKQLGNFAIRIPFENSRFLSVKNFKELLIRVFEDMIIFSDVKFKNANLRPLTVNIELLNQRKISENFHDENIFTFYIFNKM